MVELFAALGFAEGPRLRSESRFRLSPGRKLPTPARVERTPLGPDPSGGILTRFIHHGLGRLSRSRFFSVAPIPLGPGSFWQSDRTPGLLSRVPGELAQGTRNEDYSDEPPSNRTSTCRCIRLYGSTSRRMVNPAPFDRLVRPIYSGDAAHLEDVSNAPRR